MAERYSLNEQTLQFILEFEKGVEARKSYTTQELVDQFISSTYHRVQFDSYKKTPNSSMWYAIRRSNKWVRVENGTYMKK
ncbi:hypothetical protein IQ283_02155 [Alkalihalobacillus hwajinpoensis]|uniref:hypothetical protein n=1 Tax=Guptibacillus hwajinpoensis TaxID=208199 RepID=UPI0018841C58|nr:hypothetical protein [Pseudalkalibacillus hwajinpoensis]MBF0705393.1 hypothetical protein [Pseudalkalibacillus hwajinpoensis]